MTPSLSPSCLTGAIQSHSSQQISQISGTAPAGPVTPTLSAHRGPGRNKWTATGKISSLRSSAVDRSKSPALHAVSWSRQIASHPHRWSQPL